MEELKVEIEARKKDDLSFKIEEEICENSEAVKLENLKLENVKLENVKLESAKLDLNNNVVEPKKSETPEPEIFNLFFENLGKEKLTPEPIETKIIEKTEFEKNEFKQKLGLITTEIITSPSSQPPLLLTIFTATPFKYNRQKLLEINDNPNKHILEKVKKQITLSKALTRHSKTSIHAIFSPEKCRNEGTTTGQVKTRVFARTMEGNLERVKVF